MTAIARRRQPPITIRSAKAVERLAVLTRDGRSQAEVIEEALDRMPLPMTPERAAAIERIEKLLERTHRGTYPTMAEIDDELWDENGLPR